MSDSPKRKPGRPPGRQYPVRVNVSLPADLLEAITLLARAEDRSVGYIVRMLTMRGLEAAFALPESGTPAPDHGILWPDLGRVDGLIEAIRQGVIRPTRGPRLSAGYGDLLRPSAARRRGSSTRS